MNRTQIIEGPAIVIFKGITFYTKDAIAWTLGISSFDIPTTIHGVVATRYDDIVSKLTFTPAGVYADYTQLWKPWETPVIGSSLLGSTDSSVVIHTIAGQKFTIKGAGISKLPDLDFSAVKTPTGQVEISAVGENNVAWNNASKRYVQEAEAFADTGFDPAAILTQPYAAAFGAASPWDNFETEEGIKVSFDMQFQPRKIDTAGTIDLRLTGFGVTATFTPVGISEAQYNALIGVQGTGVVRGASIGGGANTLIVSGTGVHFRLYGAVPVDGGLRFDANANRCAPITLRAVRQYAAGAMQPLYYIGTAAPA